MPIAIVMSQSGAIPAIMAENTAADLIEALNGLKDTPELSNEATARMWLQSLPQPSGWFKTPDEARAHVQRMKEDVPILPGAEVAAAREALGMGRAQFALALGMGGNDNTRHKTIFEIENEIINKSSGRPRALNPNATLRLRALMAESELGE